MKKSMLMSVGLAVSLAVLAIGAAISAQDKYTLTVPNGPAFAEFQGYEDWPVIALSENGGLIAVILGNPVMIDAYKPMVLVSCVPDGCISILQTKFSNREGHEASRVGL